MTASLPYRRSIGRRPSVAGVGHRHGAEEVGVDAHVRERTASGSVAWNAVLGDTARSSQPGNRTDARAWIGGTGEHAVGLDDDRVGVAEARCRTAARTCTSWPRCSRPSSQSRRRVALDDARAGPPAPVQVSNP